MRPSPLNPKIVGILSKKFTNRKQTSPSFEENSGFLSLPQIGIKYAYYQAEREPE